ncbi:hypothetical protein UFOVP407_32 [uncultured Caudovirales phage]|uniref:Uncharacterized protein n=1 Tax=uncultured Caudovirales phage TaxID=2100421 RepID=A0A6J5M8N7_9CAUD|nr:hypothetical protein UFOVP407_32 [uncultured Caudovirales phage]
MTHTPTAAPGHFYAVWQSDEPDPARDLLADVLEAWGSPAYAERLRTGETRPHDRAAMEVLRGRLP